MRRHALDRIGQPIYTFDMPLMVQVPMPEPLLRSLGGKRADLSRQAFEALVAHQYHTGALSHFEVSELLGLHRFDTDGFLKRHSAFRPNELDEYADDAERLEKLLKK
jgi:hypothetical protein